MKEIKYFSLFTGIGGFEKGILNAYVEMLDRSENGKIKSHKTKDAKARKGLVTAQREIPESVRTFLGELPDGIDDQGTSNNKYESNNEYARISTKSESKECT